MSADTPASLPSRFFSGTIEAFKRKDVPFALAIIGILTVLLLPVLRTRRRILHRIRRTADS